MRPAAVEPVNATLATPGCPMRYSLTSRSAGSTLTTPAGKPASINRPPSSSASIATSGEALRITGLPGQQRGNHLRGRRRMRRVPRNHGRHDPNGLGGDDRLVAGGVDQHLVPVELLRGVQPSTRAVRHAALRPAGKPDGRAVLGTHQGGDFIGAGGVQLVELLNEPSPLRRIGVRPRPMVEGLSRRSDSTVNICLGCLRGVADE